ncbi:hypothetical protein [Solidesulfovibrio carbinolicus]|uniref:hypothetical protein n=1 Tax=Solidesulfovibrio carbinolicus TaxID=296842 RepID=UPI001012219D|nr:hypothetical protein [Solidesulfovibrio carbinolicus]
MLRIKNISILPKGISRAFGFRDLNEFTFIGNFGVVKKQVLRDCGMFDDAYKVYGFEDTDLMMRLCMNGCSSKLLCELPINVVHLTHSAMTEAPLVNNEAAFGDVQKNRGYYFQVNHFFGVYEGDGHAILVPCETLEAMLK